MPWSAGRVLVAEAQPWSHLRSAVELRHSAPSPGLDDTASASASADQLGDDARTVAAGGHRPGPGSDDLGPLVMMMNGLPLLVADRLIRAARSSVRPCAPGSCGERKERVNTGQKNSPSQLGPRGVF